MGILRFNGSDAVTGQLVLAATVLACAMAMESSVAAQGPTPMTPLGATPQEAPSAPSAAEAAPVGTPDGTAPAGGEETPAADSPPPVEESAVAQQALPPRGTYGELRNEASRDQQLTGFETGDVIIPARVGATSTAVGHFPGSIAIPGTAARMRFGGIVHLNATLTWTPLLIDSQFTVAAIPITDDGPGDRGPRYYMSARESRLSFDFRTPSDFGLLRAYVETDFTAEGNAPGLRHAYAQLGNLLAGHTWSLFMDVAARPEVIDIEGPDGAVALLHPSLRVAVPVGEHVELAVAAESPDAQVDTLLSADGNDPPSEPAELYPDAVARLRVHGQSGHVQLMSILRRLGRERSDDPTIHVKRWAYGGSLSGVLTLPRLSRYTRVSGQAAIGNGIARYVVSTNSAAVLGEPLDAYYNPRTNVMEPVGVFGWYVALRQGWTETLRSTGTVGGLFVNSFDSHPDTTLRRTHYFSVNLMWSPVEALDLGVEQLLGYRQDRSRAYRGATQTQLLTKLRF